MQTLSYLSSVSQKAASFTAFYFHKILFIYHNKILQCFGYGQCLFEILSKEPYLVFVFFSHFLSNMEHFMNLHVILVQGPSSFSLPREPGFKVGFCFP